MAQNRIKVDYLAGERIAGMGMTGLMEETQAIVDYLRLDHQDITLEFVLHELVPRMRAHLRTKAEYSVAFSLSLVPMVVTRDLEVCLWRAEWMVNDFIKYAQMDTSPFVASIKGLVFIMSIFRENGWLL